MHCLEQSEDINQCTFCIEIGPATSTFGVFAPIRNIASPKLRRWIERSDAPEKIINFSAQARTKWAKIM
ncbi:MAG: hypothetical protein K6T99_09190 [Armatimonadetes bacterium]|nr:hypothetical protein [Armatimonadota bacterium]